MSKTYLSEDEIVEDILSKMTDEERETWKGVTDGELILSHHFTGRSIRNEYGMWDKDNPYTITDLPLNEEGVIDHPMFPDEISMRVMRKVRDRVNDS